MATKYDLIDLQGDHIDFQGNMVRQLSQQPESQVLYHLGGLTGRSKVWANGTQK